MHLIIQKGLIEGQSSPACKLSPECSGGDVADASGPKLQSAGASSLSAALRAVCCCILLVIALYRADCAKEGGALIEWHHDALPDSNATLYITIKPLGGTPVRLARGMARSRWEPCYTKTSAIEAACSQSRYLMKKNRLVWRSGRTLRVCKFHPCSRAQGSR